MYYYYRSCLCHGTLWPLLLLLTIHVLCYFTVSFEISPSSFNSQLVPVSAAIWVNLMIIKFQAKE